MFDKVNHRVLLGFLGTRVCEKPVLDVIAKLLKVGYVSFQSLTDSELELKSGTPQGSVISPLLANVYMHELDFLVEQTLLPVYNSDRVDKLSEAYSETMRFTGTD